MLPETCTIDPARAWASRPSARRIPAAATATEGLFAMARSIACWNVTRSTTTGVCAPTVRLKPDTTAVITTAITVRLKPDTAYVVVGGVVAGVVSTFRRTLRIPFALGKALDHDIEDRNEGEVEERRC